MNTSLATVIQRPIEIVSVFDDQGKSLDVLIEELLLLSFEE